MFTNIGAAGIAVSCQLQELDLRVLSEIKEMQSNGTETTSRT